MTTEKNENIITERLNQQLNELSKKITLLKTALIISIILTILMWVVFVSFLAALGMIAIIVFVVLLRQKKAEKKSLVHEIIKDALQEKINVISYNPYHSIPEHAVSNAGLITYWDKFYGNDLVQGSYKDVPISFSDIHLIKEETYRDSKGHRHKTQTTVFKGLWMVCELPKAVASPIRLKERAKIRILPQKSDVETENIAFNEKYQILAKDHHNVFYVLTPHFMEYIMAADATAAGQTYFCFDGKFVHMAVDNRKDAFEVTLRHETIEEMKDRFQKDVQYLVEFIDELMKNKYLFGGEEE